MRFGQCALVLHSEVVHRRKNAELVAYRMDEFALKSAGDKRTRNRFGLSNRRGRDGDRDESSFRLGPTPRIAVLLPAAQYLPRRQVRCVAYT